MVVSMFSVFFASTVALCSNESSAVFYATAMCEVDRFLKGTLAEVLNFSKEYLVHIKHQNLYL